MLIIFITTKVTSSITKEYEMRQKGVKWSGRLSVRKDSALLDWTDCYLGRWRKAATRTGRSQCIEIENNPQPRASKEMGTSILQPHGTEFCLTKEMSLHKGKQPCASFSSAQPVKPRAKTQLCHAMPGLLASELWDRFVLSCYICSTFLGQPQETNTLSMKCCHTGHR